MNKKITTAMVFVFVFSVLNAFGEEKRTSLSFKSIYLSSPIEYSKTAETNPLPEILILAKIAGTSWGKNTFALKETLKKIFNLDSLRVVQTSEAKEIFWESWEEKKKDHPQVSLTLRIHNEEYKIVLIPEEILYGEKLFDVQFQLEIHRAPLPKKPDLLQIWELIYAEDILWNFRGPLTIGFAGDSFISFLTITVEATAARFGPRLGTGLSWIL